MLEKMCRNTNKGIFLALIAAALYAISSPISKLMLGYLPPVLMAGFLYIGAGVGMSAVAIVRRKMVTPNEARALREPMCLIFSL